MRYSIPCTILYHALYYTTHYTSYEPEALTECANKKLQRSKKLEHESYYSQRPRGPMDKASAYGAGDCRFESCRGHPDRLFQIHV